MIVSHLKYLITNVEEWKKENPRLSMGIILTGVLSTTLFYIYKKRKQRKAANTQEESVAIGPLKIPVGNTALWIAAVRARETRRKDALINDPFAEKLAGEEGIKIMEYYEKTIRYKSFMMDFFAIRFKFFDDFVVQKLLEQNREGLDKQVVIVAAGLDSRAFRLPFPKKTTVFEIDRDEVLKWKDDKLREVDAKITCETRICVATDLSNPNWLTELEAAGFKKEIPSVWVVEGLLGYLGETIAIQLLSAIAKASAPGTWISCNMQNSVAVSGRVMKKTHQSMKAQGNEIIFGTDYPEEFLKKSGWKSPIVHSIGDSDLSYGKWTIRILALPRWLPFHLPRWWLTEATI